MNPVSSPPKNTIATSIVQLHKPQARIYGEAINIELSCCSPDSAIEYTSHGSSNKKMHINLRARSS